MKGHIKLQHCQDYSALGICSPDVETRQQWKKIVAIWEVEILLLASALHAAERTKEQEEQPRVW